MTFGVARVCSSPPKRSQCTVAIETGRVAPAMSFKGDL